MPKGKNEKSQTGSKVQSAKIPMKGVSKKAAAVALGYASNTVAGPHSISELVRALKGDVDLIYQFVHDNIEFYPMYGVQKGALGTLIDGMGNPFDQSMLLVALLREAGYKANFAFGEITLTPSELKNWLGTDDTNPTPVDNLLTTAGIPHTVNMTGMTWNSVTLDHMWVQCNIGGTDYVFDPSYKAYTYQSGLNISSIMSYNQSTFLTNAQSGATVTATSLQNLNRTNIRSDMSTMANSLLTHIKTNNADATIEEVVGGRTIVGNTSQIRDTSHPKQASSPAIWASIPNTYRTSIRIKFPHPTLGSGNDLTLYSDDIYHRRLTLSYYTGSSTELRLDGVTIARGSVFSSGSITYTVTHNAIPSSAETRSAEYAHALNGLFAFTFAFGPCSKEASNYHKRLQEERIRAAGNSVNYAVEPILAENCYVQFFTYLALLTQNTDILGRLRQCAPMYLHHGGYIGFNNSGQYYYLSMNLGQTLKFCDLDAAVSNQAACRDAYSVLVNGTEGMTVRQQLKSGYVGVNSVMEAAMMQGSLIYDVNSASWATISPNFYFWDSAQLNKLKTDWIDNGARAFVAANGFIAVGARHGNGFWAALPSASHWAAIALGYKGAYPSDGGPPAPAGGGGSGGGGPDGDGGDPVDLYSGAFKYDKTDMVVGSDRFPYGLAFERAYRSSDNSSKSTLGYGWTHNFEVTAKQHENAYLTLGGAAAIFAVPNIAGLFVLSDLMATPTTDTLVKVVTAALVERWKSDAVGQNGVMVKIGADSDLLLKLVDGTFAPIDGRGSSVTINGSGNYVYKNKFGDTATFNSSGNIVSWAIPGGVTVSFEYQNNVLVKVSNGIGRSLHLRYNNDGYLTEVFDNAGRNIGFEYSSPSNNLVKCRDTLDAVTEYSYDDRSRLEKIFRPENPDMPVLINAYDTLGRVMSQVDANNNEMNFLFAGSRSEEVNPLGHSKVYYNDFSGKQVKIFDELGNETSREFDIFQRLTKTTLPEGNSVSMTYDAKGNVLKVEKTPKSGSGLSAVENNFTYHATWNKVATAEDGEGNTTTYTYDTPTGNLLTIERPVISAVTPTITHTYNARGQMETRTDETGIVTKWVYDTDTESLLSVINDFGTSPKLNLTSSFEYDAVGNIVTVTDPRDNVFRRKYDSERRIIETSMSEPFEFITQHEYNLNGKMTSRRTQSPGFPVWQQTSFAYNHDGKVTEEVDPLGQVTKYGYDALRRLATITDAEGRTTVLSYDERSKLAKVLDWSSNVSQVREYSDNGKIIEVTDGNGNVTQFSYDGLDRLDRTTFEDATFEENTSYDDNSNVLVFTTRDNKTVTSTFDVLNRLSTKTPQGMPTVTYTYDLANRLTGVSTPTVMGDPGSGSFVNSYDSAGRFYREQYPDSKQVTYQLDENGNITRLTYPDGYYVEREYDELNRLTAIKLNGSSTAEVRIEYDPLSRRASMEFANGTSTEYAYALNNDVLGIAHNFAGSSVDIGYEYSNASQVVRRNVSDDQFMWHPAAAGTLNYGAASDLNQYPTVGADSYSYNNNGCLTGDGVWTFGYDAINRLTSAIKSGVNASYLYDPLNRQSQKDVGGTKTRFIYSGAQRIAEYNGTSGALITRFVHAKGLDEPVVEVTSGGAKTYFHRDRDGSIIAKSNTSGAVTNRYEYGPFGESAALSGTTFGYTGQRYDAESGLYFYKTRYYSPAIGRFLQPDMIGYGDGLNVYAYVDNQPVDRTDPLGTGDGPTDDPRVYQGSGGGGPLGGLFRPHAELLQNQPDYDISLGLKGFGALGAFDPAADFGYGYPGIGYGIGMSGQPAGFGRLPTVEPADRYGYNSSTSYNNVSMGKALAAPPGVFEAGPGSSAPLNNASVGASFKAPSNSYAVTPSTNSGLSSGDSQGIGMMPSVGGKVSYYGGLGAVSPTISTSPNVGKWA